MLTQERLKEILDYNHETGIFTWKIEPPNRPYLKGKEAGCYDKDGYIQIRIKGIGYSAHCLAFLFMEGYLPEGLVGHKDRIKDHNWWSNLREASNQCQSRNSGLALNNTSGIKGVDWIKRKNKWRASIKINNKTKYLGEYLDFIEAAAHRFAAEQCTDWQDCDIDSSSGQTMKDYVNK